VAPHELSEAARMAGVDAGELIQVERRRPRPVAITFLVHPSQLGVGIDRRPSGCEPQNEVWLFSQRLGNAAGKRPGNRVAAVEDCDFHAARAARTLRVRG
jgi:hypothetical protein